MDIGLLQTFLAVVEEGSFSRASRRLFRSQPAVSLAVKRLEEEVGERLLDRSSKSLTLTDAGELVLGYARRYAGMERELAVALEELRDRESGKLTVGANESTALYLLTHIERFRKQYPRIKVEIQRHLSSRIPEAVLHGAVELGAISYDPKHPQLSAKEIYTDSLTFIVSPSHRHAGKDNVSIRELGDETFIAHNVVSPYRERVIDTFREFGVPLDMSVEMPTIETIRKLVQVNLGVAFLPKMCVAQEIESGAVCEVPVDELQMERKIRLVAPSRRQLSHACRGFLELVSEVE